MNDEPSFFDGKGKVVAFARRTDPDTSHEAAADVSTRLRELQLAVLEYAQDREPLGFIDPEMNQHFKTYGSTYRTRRSELVAKGLIYDTGERRKAADSNRRHAVWRITILGTNRLGGLKDLAA